MVEVEALGGGAAPIVAWIDIRMGKKKVLYLLTDRNDIIIIGHILHIQDLRYGLRLIAVIILRNIICGFGTPSETQEIQNDKGIRESEKSGDRAGPHVGIVRVAVDEDEGGDGRFQGVGEIGGEIVGEGEIVGGGDEGFVMELIHFGGMEGSFLYTTTVEREGYVGRR